MLAPSSFCHIKPSEVTHLNGFLLRLFIILSPIECVNYNSVYEIS